MNVLLIAMIQKDLPNGYKIFTTEITQKDTSMTFQIFKIAQRNFEEAEKIDNNTPKRSNKREKKKMQQSANNVYTKRIQD